MIRIVVGGCHQAEEMNIVANDQTGIASRSHNRLGGKHLVERFITQDAARNVGEAHTIRFEVLEDMDEADGTTPRTEHIRRLVIHNKTLDGRADFINNKVQVSVRNVDEYTHIINIVQHWVGFVITVINLDVFRASVDKWQLLHFSIRDVQLFRVGQGMVHRLTIVLLFGRKILIQFE